MPDCEQDTEHWDALKTIVLTSFDPFCVLDEQGQILLWNQPWQEIATDQMSLSKGCLLNDCTALPQKSVLCKAFSDVCKTKTNCDLSVLSTSPEDDKAGVQARIFMWEPWIAITLRLPQTAAKNAYPPDASETNLNDFMNSIDDLVFITDEQARILFSNAAVTTKLGYTSNQLVGTLIFDLHPPALRQEARTIFMDMLDGQRESCPLPMLRADGAPFPMETRVRFGKWRGMNCVYGIARDLSELQAANKKFRKFFDSNPALMAVTSLKTSRLVEVNQAFLTALGYTREEAVGKTSRELSLFLNPNQHALRAQQLISKGDIPSMELLIRHKDGHLIVGQYSATYIEHLGEVSLLSVMVDVTAQKAAETLLQKKDRLFKQIINTIPDQICFTDAEGRFRAANRAFAESYLGVPEATILGKTIAELRAEYPDRSAWQTLAAFGEKADATMFEHTLPMADGTSSEVETVRTPLFSDEGHLDGVISVSRDITARRESERELRSSEVRLNLATESAHVVVWDWNPQTGKAMISDQWKDILGLTTEQAAQLEIAGWRTLIHPEDFTRAMRSLENHLQGHTDHFEHEARVRKPNGGWVWVLHMGSVVEWDEKHRPIRVTGTLIDITQRKQTEEQLAQKNRDLQDAYVQMRRMATTDTLTGLLNRREIIRLIEAEGKRYLRTKKTFSVIMADIDHFKRINDLYRHQMGDSILVGLAALFQQSVRSLDSVARWGGEEFLFLLPDTEEAAAAELAERIRVAVQEMRFAAQNGSVCITVSFGVSCLRDVRDMEAVLDQADSALYRSKEEGRNRVSVYPVQRLLPV